MSSGHASHKGNGVKHSHDTAQLDSAATTPSDPQDILGEGEGYPFNAQGGEVNPAAVERPDHNAEETSGQTSETSEQQVGQNQ
jgi:hypothetical protein